MVSRCGKTCSSLLWASISVSMAGPPVVHGYVAYFSPRHLALLQQQQQVNRRPYGCPSSDQITLGCIRNPHIMKMTFTQPTIRVGLVGSRFRFRCLRGHGMNLHSSDGDYKERNGDGEDHNHLPLLFHEEITSALHERLEGLGVDVGPLVADDPTEVGASALRAYRSYFKGVTNRKRNDRDHQNDDVSKTAARTAQQIRFLVARHRSRTTEWIRNHHDDDPTFSPTKAAIQPVSLLLDNLRSAANVGSIFRTADACGCTEVITTGITPHPRGSGWEKLSKSALGADATVPTRHFETVAEALVELRRGPVIVKVVGLETTERSVPYTSLNYGADRTHTCFVLGNEVTGLDPFLLEQLDAVVEIPMYGSKNSLNVAACAPVVLYEALRQIHLRETEQEEEDEEEKEVNTDEQR